ncbi:helix-turn-helix transcriptional regulator [Paenibacillus cremeus]|uniref:Helix-turn-helix domain-containing protein n=1 Tax=Paenibacillus cremeus TaxID=2163881 RepID=A0A559KAK9_9BACL|nr:AraC family transcriptional regulator [Paenibacillus cremeus]TVY09167.1 helix-turn-helix domain-containing protein [Paenibacillus cremeus]
MAEQRMKKSSTVKGGGASSRWTYEAENKGPIEDVPELVMFGCDEFRKAHPLRDHAHPGCFEFVLVERGKAGWELDGTVYETKGGDVFHTRPGERHRGGFNVIEPSKIWWLIVSSPTPQSKDWLRLPPNEIAALESALAALPRVVHTGLRPVDTFIRLQQALMTESPLRSTFIRQSIVELLLHFVRPETVAASVADDLVHRFESLIERMRREPEWRPAVAQLAEEAGVSESHFYRTFQAYSGLSPNSYMERLRLKEACRWLEESTEPITHIAHQLGYPSSQHFATVFKRYTGQTPSRWRANSISSGITGSMIQSHRTLGTSLWATGADQ